MKLSSIIDKTECAVFGDENIEIKGVKYDSRQVEPGDLFFCITGFETDGHRFASSAVEKGAVCLVVTRKLDLPVTQVIVKDDRAAMATISTAFYGYPAKGLRIIGITGTNGKTTTTYMIKSICERKGSKVGLIGTIKTMIGDKTLKTERTTPESPDLQRIFYQMKKEGVDTIVMEVSSHSLELKRVLGIDFEVGLFTNLTQDHLDFHGSFESYAKAKRMLCEASKNMVINIDDSYGEYMIEASRGKVMTYGIEQGDLTARHILVSPQGTEFDICKKGKCERIEMCISGFFTIYNALSAAAVCLMLNIDMDTIKRGLMAVKGVPGRFESLDTGKLCASVILDYAHTPDSLENTLKSACGFAKGRVVCVVGCGGNRDSTKRPIMGRIAGEYSDFCILTSDNPRFEEPNAIISQIEPGVKEAKGDYIVIENRREAIKYALQNAKKHDIIILAGKGHEDYQEICGVKYPFDEKVIVRELLEELGY